MGSAAPAIGRDGGGKAIVAWQWQAIVLARGGLLPPQRSGQKEKASKTGDQEAMR